MRILQVVTYVAPGNPFGGPVHIARAHTDDLRRRGHEVDLYAAQPRSAERRGWTSDDLGVTGFDSYKPSKGAGFNGIVSPKLLWRAAREVCRYDVVHLHLTRDLVTLPVAAIAMLRKVPYVIQPNGMVDPSDRRSAKVLDALLTRRVLKRAAAVLAVTPQEDADLAAVEPSLGGRVRRLVNGVRSDEVTPVDPPTGPRRFLFCSRLQARKRPDLFTSAAVRLVTEGSTAEFVLHGTDEGEAATVQQLAAPASDRVAWRGPLEPAQVGAAIDACSVLVLPSEKEPFAVVVIEALAAARPVIITSECGLAPYVERFDAGIVIEPRSEESLVSAMRRLDAMPSDELREMGRRGRQLVETELDLAVVVGQLEQTYLDVAGRGRGSSTR